MTDDALSFRDYLPVITGLGGLVIGGLISELHTALAGVRERRRALNVLLYELLELRAQIQFSNPRNLLDLLTRYAVDRFGPDGAQGLRQPDVRQLVSQMLQQAAASFRGDLAARYSAAVIALAPFYPLLAYRLKGYVVSRFEAVVGQWYERVGRHPEVANDPNAPMTLAVMEQETLDLVAAEALEQLAEDIRTVARACGWRMRANARAALKKQDARIDERLHSQLAGKLDQFLATVAATTAAHQRPRAPLADG